MAEITIIPDKIENRIQYCIDIILKEAKLEDLVVKQLFYTMLSMYTNDPRNAGVTSPTGEGKNYVIHKVADIFPKEDIINYVGMTQKSIFHKNGVLVIKNEVGDYEPIEDSIKKLDSTIEDKQSEMLTTNNPSLKQALNSQIKEIEKEKKELFKDAKKLIDLSHKCIIFLDTPPQELLNAIMSLLSHDEYEVEYEFVDTSAGIKTRSNVLRGWPVVIFAQAVDYSHHKRWPEIRRRFTICNPRMDKEKYKAAISLIADKSSLPDFMYQEDIINDLEKEQAREIVKTIKEKIMDISGSVTPGRNNIFIPFSQAIKESLASSKASDMTAAERIFKHLTLLAQVNIENRPIISFRKSGEPVAQKIPLCTFADLKETLSLIKSSNGVRPYVLEWYYDVFLNCYNDKTQPDTKVRDSRTIEENRIAVTTQQLADATETITTKKLSTRQIRETYLDQLINEGYVDSQSSELDRKADIYYPVVTTRIGEKENTHISVKDSLFPSAFYLKSQIQALLDRRKGSDILEMVPNLSIDELVDRHYSKPEEIFSSTSKQVVSPIKIKDEINPVSQNETEQGRFSEKGRYSPILLLSYYDIINRREQSGSIVNKSLRVVEKEKQSNCNQNIEYCKYCNFQTSSKFDLKWHDSNVHGKAWS